MSVILLLLLQFVCVNRSAANDDAKRLFDDLMKGREYNRLIRPVRNSTDILDIKVGLRLAQLLNVDEKNQIITANVLLIQEWKDSKLGWNPDYYGNVTRINIPSEDLWLPDIVLYNNADGDYTITLRTKATVSWDGTILWEPPAVFKFQCEIDIEYFPFDLQVCKLKFGIWSYDGTQVDLKHIWTELLQRGEEDCLKSGVDLDGYYPNQEWDLMGAPAKKTRIKYPCCAEVYPDVTFWIKIRRKTLFYTYNLIIPCVCINILTVLVFYLPADSGEKISVSVTILLSLTVFFLLLIDLIPPTSRFGIPLMGKYLLFTMVLLIFSIVLSVINLNLRYRSPTSHSMPPWISAVFLDFLPPILLMKRPRSKKESSIWKDEEYVVGRKRMQDRRFRQEEIVYGDDDEDEEDGLNRVSSTFVGVPRERIQLANKLCKECNVPIRNRRGNYPANVQKAIDGLLFVTKHLKDDDFQRLEREEWKYVALVIDRLFFLVYTSLVCVGSLSLLLQAPSLFNSAVPINSTVYTDKLFTDSNKVDLKCPNA